MLLDHNEDEVRIRYLHDFTPSAGPFHCTAGTECVIDAVTATALILIGLAVKIAPAPAA